MDYAAYQKKRNEEAIQEKAAERAKLDMQRMEKEK